MRADSRLRSAQWKLKMASVLGSHPTVRKKLKGGPVFHCAWKTAPLKKVWKPELWSQTFGVLTLPLYAGLSSGIASLMAFLTCPLEIKP